MSAYGPKADHLGASATGANTWQFLSRINQLAGIGTGRMDTRQLLNRAHFYTGKGEFHA
jgi:hypothetical protein